MTIPALVRLCCWAGCLASLVTTFPKVSNFREAKPREAKPEVIFISPTEPAPNLQLPDSIWLLKPRYENPLQTRERKPITYDVQATASQPWLEGLQLGTQLFTAPKPPFDSISTLYPFDIEGLELVQVVKRSSDDFVGYMEEMLNVPFVLPPRYLYGHGHQSDLRLGVDCAEMVIYARRRQGHEVPYCGPRGIYDYVQETSSLQRGTILHFGHQVSALYQDLGEKGKLDAEDLLIHAYEDKAEIVALGKTDLDAERVGWFEWRE